MMLKMEHFTIFNQWRLNSSFFICNKLKLLYLKEKLRRDVNSTHDFVRPSGAREMDRILLTVTLIHYIISIIYFILSLRILVLLTVLCHYWKCQFSVECVCHIFLKGWEVTLHAPTKALVFVYIYRNHKGSTTDLQLCSGPHSIIFYSAVVCPSPLLAGKAIDSWLRVHVYPPPPPFHSLSLPPSTSSLSSSLCSSVLNLTQQSLPMLILHIHAPTLIDTHTQLSLVAVNAYASLKCPSSRYII